MSLYFGYKKPSSNDTEELEKQVTALKTQLATNNSKTTSLESSVFKKDGSVSMTGDMDMSDNAIVGIDDINANNSVLSKKYVDDNLATKIGYISNFVLEKYTFVGGLSMSGSKIQNVSTPTNIQDAANKYYVDEKTTTNANNITKAGVRLIALESKPKIYTYTFSYGSLGTTFSSPLSTHSTPTYWFYCKGLSMRSKFHLHNLIYDSDSSIPNDYTFTFQLDFFDTSGNHYTHTLGTVTKRAKGVTGENILFIDEKYSLSSVTNYTNFIMGRLQIKGSSSKGNEFTVSCSIEV